jgi:hypothetical protein
VAPATGTVSSQESATTGVATSLGVTHPTGLADGDLVIIITSCVRNGGGAVTWTGPSGFTQIGTDQALSSGTMELTVWARRIVDAGTEGTWTVSVSHGGTAPTTANLAAIAARITGAEDPADLAAVFTIENTAVLSFVAPTVTVDDNDSLIYAGACAQRPGTWTSPSGYGELADLVTTGNTGANESSLCLADSDALKAAGTEAPGTFTYSQTRQGISYTIAIGPGAAGETTGVAAGALGGLVGTGTGDSVISAVAAGTLGGLTGAVTGDSVITATAAGTLGGLSGAASGTVRIVGTASGSLGGLTGTAADAGAVEGTATGTLGGLVGAATGKARIVAVAAGILGGLTGAATGDPVTVGVATGTLGGLVGAATDADPFAGAVPPLTAPTATPVRTATTVVPVYSAPTEVVRP